MLIKIGPIEIRTGVDKISSSTEVGIFLDGPTTQRKTKQKSFVDTIKRQHPFIKQIAWPTVNSDPYDQTLLSVLITKMESDFTKNYFSICCLDDFCTKVHVIHDEESRAARDVLRTIHCIDFPNIHPEIVRSIPELVSKVLARVNLVN